MLLLDDMRPTLVENLALEDAVLDEAELGNWSREFFRIWQPASYFVAIGRGAKISEEVDLAAAEVEDVPVFRRISGGGAVVAGPGCLLYATMLSLEQRPELRMIDAAHNFVMTRMLAALQPVFPGLRIDGICDLVKGDRKISGNSMRVRRNWLLYHGTLLLNMDLNKLELLKHPPREPNYRAGRAHAEFVSNAGGSYSTVRNALVSGWQAVRSQDVDLPEEKIQQLVTTKYGNPQWNRER